MKNLNPKQWTLVLLLALAALGAWRYGPAVTLPQVAAAVVAAIVADALFLRVRAGKFAVSSSAAISGVIIGSVASPGLGLAAAAALSAAAMASKHLLRVANRPVFNPAALALFGGAALFGLKLGWWADSSSYLTVIAGSAALALFSGRWRLVFSFVPTALGFAALRAVIEGRPVQGAVAAALPILAYFSFFMLTDPRTSPVMPRSLPYFGFAAALGSFISAYLFPASTLLSGLLFANVVALALNRLDMRRVAAAAQTRIKTPANS